MTYQELLDNNGGAFASNLEWLLARRTNSNIRTVRTMKLSALIEIDSQVQRALCNQVLLHRDWFTGKVHQELLQLVTDVYSRHSACKSADIRHYGVCCNCGAYYNPALKPSVIWGLSTAILWNVE